jgi:hypothetical protein
MMIVVPMSGSEMMSAPIVPSRMTNGTKPSENLVMSLPREESQAEM